MDNMTIIHEHIASVADKVTIASSAGAVVGWATSHDVGMWAGILIGFLGLVVNWYFKRKSDRRSQEAHDVYITKLRHVIEVIPVIDDYSEADE